MTWHLKDRELEKVLEKYSDGNFVKALNFAIERDWIDAANVVTVEFERKFLSRGYTNDLSFRTDELEEVPEYNPKIWNDYRKVTPPENCVFRAKVYWTSFEGETIVDYDCLIYQYSSWYRVRNCKPFGGRLNITKGEHVEFKAWED